MSKDSNAHHAHPLKQVFISSMNGYTAQIIDDIMYISASNGIIEFHMSNGKITTSTESIDHFEKQLTDYNFVRIHHNTLLNIDYFKEYHKGRGGDVILLNGETLHVSVHGKVNLDKILKGNN